MLFKIYVKDLVLYGYHGVNKSEKQDGQYFVYNLKIILRENYLLKNDNITETVNYSEAINILKNINSKNKFDLLETLAFECVSELFSLSDLIDEIEISIEKENPPIEETLKSVGVSFLAQRKDFLHTDKPEMSENNTADDINYDNQNSYDNQKAKCFLSLGTNLGNRLDNLKKALKLLIKKNILKIIKISAVYETAPMYVKEQPEFYNVVLQTELNPGLSPFVLLGHLKDIEFMMGRQNTLLRNGPRIIDMDILDIEGVTINSEILRLPHHGLKKRNFVLIPLSEIAPGYTVDNVSIKEYIKKCNYPDNVKKIKKIYL